MSTVIEKFGEYLCLLDLSDREAIDQLIEELNTQLRALYRNEINYGTPDTVDETYRMTTLMRHIRSAVVKIKNEFRD